MTTTTRNTIITRAFRRIGIDSPAVDDFANAADLLRMICYSLDPIGRWLWKIANTEATLTLVAGQRVYTTADGLPSNIYAMEPDAAFLIRGTSRIPLRVISKRESITSFELEETTGEPYMVHLEQAVNPANNKLHFLPTPSGGDTVGFAYQARIVPFADGAASPDVPPEMEMDLIKILAAELGPEHGYAAEMQGQLEQMAEMARRRMISNNKERVSATPAQGVYF